MKDNPEEAAYDEGYVDGHEDGWRSGFEEALRLWRLSDQAERARLLNCPRAGLDVHYDNWKRHKRHTGRGA